MSTKLSSHQMGLTLTTTVALFSLAVLGIGWGVGVDQLVRVSAESNAIVPSTALCLILVATAAIPLPRLAILQRVILVAAFITLLSIATLDLFAGVGHAHQLGFAGSDSDGMSHATVIGLSFALIAPAVRLRMLPLAREWEFHASLFGTLVCAALTLVTTLDPFSFDHIPLFINLSQYTAILLTLLFAGQLAAADQIDLSGDADFF